MWDSVATPTYQHGRAVGSGEARRIILDMKPGQKEIEGRNGFAGVDAAAAGSREGDQAKQPQTLAPFPSHIPNLRHIWLKHQAKN